jgi:hypothetical protein
MNIRANLTLWLTIIAKLINFWPVSISITNLTQPHRAAEIAVMYHQPLVRSTMMSHLMSVYVGSLRRANRLNDLVRILNNSPYLINLVNDYKKQVIFISEVPEKFLLVVSDLLIHVFGCLGNFVEPACISITP